MELQYLNPNPTRVKEPTWMAKKAASNVVWGKYRKNSKNSALWVWSTKPTTQEKHQKIKPKQAFTLIHLFTHFFSRWHLIKHLLLVLEISLALHSQQLTSSFLLNDYDSIGSVNLRRNQSRPLFSLLHSLLRFEKAAMECDRLRAAIGRRRRVSAKGWGVQPREAITHGWLGQKSMGAFGWTTHLDFGLGCCGFYSYFCIQVRFLF